VTQRRARLALGLGGLLIVVVLVASTLGGGSLPRPPRPTAAEAARRGDLFGYVAARHSQFTARATAGEAHVLFTKSPGGVLLTAARVAAFRGAVNRAVAGTGIDPNLLEALIFVESAGEPDAIAGTDPANAAGLTQILAATGQSLLGMHIDLARSRRLTAAIAAVRAGRRQGRLATLVAQRAAADDRFVPARALAATVRYLRISEHAFGREDLAFESYHMGIGNLHNVLAAYDGGRVVPYVQLFFDSEPDHHAASYRLLSGFGDDSELYWWRLLGAEQVMHLYRTDRGALERLAALQTADDAGAAVLHPPGRPARFSDPAALAAAYQHRGVVPLPSNPTSLGLAYAPVMGTGAKRVGATAALYRGLDPTALRLLIALAARVRSLAGGAEPLVVQSAVADARYLNAYGLDDPPATTGYSFTIARHYRSRTQAVAFQAMLDQLQALHLIAWSRGPSTIEITVATDAGRWVG
jgi:hypothetical protein